MRRDERCYTHLQVHVVIHGYEESLVIQSPFEPDLYCFTREIVEERARIHWLDLERCVNMRNLYHIHHPRSYLYPPLVDVALIELF